MRLVGSESWASSMRWCKYHCHCPATEPLTLYRHLKYTIPPAIALTGLYRPFATRLDVYRVLFLICIAVASTIPWDSYLIRRRIWTYPPQVIIGPTLFSIPAEELFFFVIQTYNTSLIYLILNKATFHPAYLSNAPNTRTGRIRARLEGPSKWICTAAIARIIAMGASLIRQGREGTYMGLILVWAGPFVLLLWSLSGRFIQRLPLINTLLPIVLPTVYLWIVDTLALKRGTWAIEAGTKLGVHLWDGLEVEEAFFFFATNTLIVFGLLAFDNAVAILNAFPGIFPVVPELPSPVLLVRALLVSPSRYDEGRLQGFREALARLKSKSRSFYFASAFFEGRLRIDLMLLYSFCRVADDLVDDAPTQDEALQNVARLRKYLDLAYSSASDEKNPGRMRELILSSFPPETHSALLYLPTDYLSSAPLYDLLQGFETDLNFTLKPSEKPSWPIADHADLQKYAACVAGTVAELCLELILHHTTTDVPTLLRQHLVQAGGRMGISLQHVNIARDIAVDARINRVYLPTSWLKEQNLTPEDVIRSPETHRVMILRERILDEADGIYRESRSAIEALPSEARGPMRVAVESYMEIGRVLREGVYKVKAGRATVPKLRRLRVGWQALSRV